MGDIAEQTTVRYFPAPEQLAGAAALELHGLLHRRETTSPFGLALSGGRIASEFYSQLTKACTRSPVSFAEVHFFWADERCLPPMDPASNFYIARTFLLDPLNIPTSQIHRIAGETDPEFAAAHAEAEICRILPMNNEAQPVIDLVILGMGEDGHVASLFPGEANESRESSKVYRSIVAQKPPPNRITIGYRTLYAAREIWVLASGPGKSEAFNRLMAGDLSLPIAQVIQRREKTLIFQDITPAKNL